LFDLNIVKAPHANGKAHTMAKTDMTTQRKTETGALLTLM